MANPDLPKGFEPWGKLLRVGVYESGSAVYPGDVVMLASDGQVDPATAGVATGVLGVALSYASASGVAIAVADHPDQLFACQADEADIDAQTDIGGCCDHIATAGSSTYKASRHELNSSDISATLATFQLLRIEPNINNALGAQVKVVVKVAEHQLGHAAVTAGV